MGTKLTRRTMFQQLVTQNTDRVVAGIWVPANSMVLSAAGFFDYVNLGPIPVAAVKIVGASMWWLPVDDPDSTGTMDTMWDTQVPKDTAGALLDMDTAAVDPTPEWQPGEPKWEQLYDIGAATRQVWEGHAMSHVGRAISVFRDPATPFDIEYLPGGSMSVNLPKSFRTEGPGLLCLGISSPDLAALSATASVAALAEDEWGRIQFIDHVVQQAMMSLLGLVESGAETPWQEATALLEDYLVPPMLEGIASSYSLSNWNIVGEMVFKIIVEGNMQQGSIDLG